MRDTSPFSFRELMEEINWSWQPNGQAWHQIREYEDGYVVDKLEIYQSKTGTWRARYKDQYDKPIPPEVMDKFVKFVEFMKSNLD